MGNSGEFRRRVSRMRKGQRVSYHRGYLFVDRQIDTELDRFAREVMEASSAGSIALVQKRHGPKDYEYIAVKK